MSQYKKDPNLGKNKKQKPDLQIGDLVQHRLSPTTIGIILKVTVEHYKTFHTTYGLVLWLNCNDRYYFRTTDSPFQNLIKLN